MPYDNLGARIEAAARASISDRQHVGKVERLLEYYPELIEFLQSDVPTVVILAAVIDQAADDGYPRHVVPSISTLRDYRRQMPVKVK